MAASAIQVGFSWLKTRKVGAMLWAILVLSMSMGGLTLYMHDEQFIKWKLTIVNWLFGSVFLASQWFGEKTMIERGIAAFLSSQNDDKTMTEQSLGTILSLPRGVLRKLNLIWALFYFFLGGANYFVMTTFDTATWVNFKLFGMLGLTIAFMLPQLIYLSRHLHEPEPQTEKE
jgi:intracellular septation protein